MYIEQNKTKFEGIYWDQSLELLQNPKSTSRVTLFCSVALLKQFHVCVCVKFVRVKVFLELLSRYFHQLSLQLFLLVNLERGTVIFSSHFLWNKQNISGFFVCSFLSACLAGEHHLSMGWTVKDISPVKMSFHICMYAKTNKRHEVGLYFRKLNSRLLTTWLLAGHETGIGINISLWRDGY